MQARVLDAVLSAQLLDDELRIQAHRQAGGCRARAAACKPSTSAVHSATLLVAMPEVLADLLDHLPVGVEQDGRARPPDRDCRANRRRQRASHP